MMQIIKQTDKEKMAMYMKMPKKKLVAMLIQCNKILDTQYAGNQIFAQPDVSGSFHLTPLEQQAFKKSGSNTLKLELGSGIGMGVSYKDKNGKWKDITDYGSW